jgi:hypothetical protein
MADFKAWRTDAPVDVVAEDHHAAAKAMAEQIPEDSTDAHFIVVSDDDLEPSTAKDQRVYIAWRDEKLGLRVFGYELGCLPEDNKL